MNKPTKTDYLQTDGTVNWKKYADALDAYIESLSSDAKDEGEGMTTIGQKIDNILENYYQKKIDLLEVRKRLLMIYSTPPPSLSAEEYWREKEKVLIERIGERAMIADKVYLTKEVWQFMTDYARTVGDKPTVKEDLTVAGEVCTFCNTNPICKQC